MTNVPLEGAAGNVRHTNDTRDNTMLHDVGSMHDGGTYDHDYGSVELLLQHLCGCELKVVPGLGITNNYLDDHNAAQLLDDFDDLSGVAAQLLIQQIDDLCRCDSRLEVIQEENSVDAELLLDDLSGCDARVREQKFNDRPAISRLEVIQEENSVDAEFSGSSERDQLYLP